MRKDTKKWDRNQKVANEIIKSFEVFGKEIDKLLSEGSLDCDEFRQ